MQKNCKIIAKLNREVTDITALANPILSNATAVANSQRNKVDYDDVTTQMFLILITQTLP